MVGLLMVGGSSAALRSRDVSVSPGGADGSGRGDRLGMYPPTLRLSRGRQARSRSVGRGDFGRGTAGSGADADRERRVVAAQPWAGDRLIKRAPLRRPLGDASPL